MTLIEKVLFLQNVELLSSLSPEQLGNIALITQEVEFPRGKVLFREKERSDSLYVIIDGKISLDSDGERILLAGEKNVVGTWALLDDEPMVVTATLLTKVSDGKHERFPKRSGTIREDGHPGSAGLRRRPRN